MIKELAEESCGRGHMISASFNIAQADISQFVANVSWIW